MAVKILLPFFFIKYLRDLGVFDTDRNENLKQGVTNEDMRFSLSKIPPRISILCSMKQAQI
jgi:hypothetical protein